MACKFYQTNSCMKGDRCPYRHELLSRGSAPHLQQAQQPRMSAARLCAQFEETGICRHGDKCRYLHRAPFQKRLNFKTAAHTQGKPALKQPKMKQKACLTNIIRYVSSSLPGASFPQPSGELSFKDHHYRIERGHVLLLDKQDKTRVLRGLLLPAGHTAVYCLLPFGLVSYDPTAMCDINPESHYLRVLCQPDLSLLQTAVRIALPYEPGATKYLVQGSTVILFKPYTDVRLDREYYRAISVYRWNVKQQAFNQGLHWSKDQFHITCASSTHEYVVLSRLPYNPAALEEAMQKQQLHQSHTDILARLTRTVTILENKVEYEARARRQAEQQRLEAERKQREADQLLAKQVRERAEQYRRADPMDFFVWNKRSQEFTHVLEYTKPVDRVLVTSDRKLHVGINTIVSEGANLRSQMITHTFDVKIGPELLESYHWDYKGRVKVDKLTPDF